MAESLFFSACCHTFSARTDLSPTSQHLVTRVFFQFDNSHWMLDSPILPSPLLEQLDHNFALLFLSWVLGSHPWLFLFFSGPWIPSLAVFFFTSIWHVFHQTYDSLLGCSSSLLVNLPLTHWQTASPPALLLVAGCDRDSVSCFKHTLLNTSLALL